MLGISSGKAGTQPGKRQAWANLKCLSGTLTSCCSCGDSDESTLTTTHRHIAIPVSLPTAPSPAHYGSLRLLERPRKSPTPPAPNRDFTRLRATTPPQHEYFKDSNTNASVQQTWERDNREVFWPRASSATPVVRTSGPISTTRRDCWAQLSSLLPSVYVLTTWNPTSMRSKSMEGRTRRIGDKGHAIMDIEWRLMNTKGFFPRQGNRP